MTLNSVFMLIHSFDFPDMTLEGGQLTPLTPLDPPLVRSYDNHAHGHTQNFESVASHLPMYVCYVVGGYHYAVLYTQSTHAQVGSYNCMYT